MFNEELVVKIDLSGNQGLKVSSSDCIYSYVNEKHTIRDPNNCFLAMECIASGIDSIELLHAASWLVVEGTTAINLIGA